MATPTEHGKRDYAVYLRGPVALNTFAYALTDAYRSGVQHLGLMTMIPAPSDSMEADFGILVGGGFSVELADEPDGDWYLLWDDGSRILLEDGSGVVILEY